MELRDYLSILAARRHLVIAVFVAAIAVACAVTLLQPAKWTAVATLRVEPSTSLVGGSVQADDVKYLDRVVNTYSQLASSPEMANRVAAELHLAAPPDIEFAQVPNTNLVKLKVTTGDRDSAAPAARRVTSLPHLAGRHAGSRRRECGREIVLEPDEAPRAREGAGPGRARLARRGHVGERHRTGTPLARGDQRREPAAGSASSGSRALPVHAGGEREGRHAGCGAFTAPESREQEPQARPRVGDPAWRRRRGRACLSGREPVPPLPEPR